MIDKVGTATDSKNKARPIQVIFVTVILTFVAWFTAHSQNVKLTIFYSRKPSLVWKVAPLSLVWGSPLPQLWDNQEKPKSAVSPPLID
jgi:hypothetical protein